MHPCKPISRPLFFVPILEPAINSRHPHSLSGVCYRIGSSSPCRLYLFDCLRSESWGNHRDWNSCLVCIRFLSQILTLRFTMPSSSSSSSSSDDGSTLKASTETTPLLAAASSAPVGEAAAAAAGPASNQEDGPEGVFEDDDTPIPVAQIALLCYARLIEPIAFFSIFPYINAMIERTGGVAKEDVGFYSGLIESLFSATQMCVMLFWGKVNCAFRLVGRLADLGRPPTALEGSLSSSYRSSA